MSTPVRTLVLWCPDWPVVAGRRSLDEPVVVVHANRVVAASPAARHHGIRRGLRRREAQGRCPGVEVIERDERAEARHFEAVATALDAITPRVEITRPGSCALATRGPSRYFGGDEALAERVLEAAHGVVSGHVRVGVADGPFAAGLAARRAADGATLVVAPGGSAAFLAPLPVGSLERPDTTEVLLRLGLRTLGSVAALPLGDVVGRFGREGEAIHRLASGLDERPLAAEKPPPDLEVVAELDPPVERVDQAAFIAKSLADELEARLGEHSAACTRLLIAAETEHGEELVRLWRHEGALGPHAVAERLRWQLDGWLNGAPASRPSGGLTRLVLRPDEIVPGRGRQLGFWGGRTASAELASRAVARVQGLVGPRSVTVPERRGGRNPDQQMALVPIDADALVEEQRGSGGADAEVEEQRGSVGADADADALVEERRGSGGADAEVEGSWPGRIPPPSPAVVHRPPRAAELVDEEQQPVTVSARGAMSAPPRWLAIDGEPAIQVEAWAGPWPIDERWWDPDGRRRRARFQVAAAGGQAYLVGLEGGRWWVDATYD